MTTVYYALIADLMGSRGFTPVARRRLQNDLYQVVRDFNAHWRKERAARFAITGGDELQGLVRSPRAIWAITHALRHRFPHADWVIAWGRGPLATRIAEHAAAPELDGPCFHHARDALAVAKEERLVLTLGGVDDPRLTALTYYYSALYWSWTRRQRTAAATWRDTLAGSRLSAPLASARGRPGSRRALHPSAVSHLRRRMGWPLVAAGDRVFQALLEAPPR